MNGQRKEGGREEGKGRVNIARLRAVVGLLEVR